MQMPRVCMAQIPLGCDMDVTSCNVQLTALCHSRSFLSSEASRATCCSELWNSETDRNRFNQDANVFLGLPKSKEIPRKSGGDVSHSVINNGLIAFKAWVESSATDWIFMLLNHFPKCAPKYIPPASPQSSPWYFWNIFGTLPQSSFNPQ